MKKILITGLTSNYGGIESTIINMCKLLDKSKYKIDFVNRSKKPLAYSDELKNEYNIFNVTSYYKSRIKYYIEFKKILKKNNYDFVYCNYSSSRFILDAICTYRNSNSKIIIHVHNASSTKNVFVRIKESINKKILRRIGNYFLSPSLNASKYFYTPKIIDSDRHFKIENFIDTNTFKYRNINKEEKRKKLGLPNCFILCNIGKYCKNKNQDFLIEIVNYLNSINIKTKLLLIGNTYNKKFNNNVICTSVITNVKDYLEACDVFVFPSIKEGYGISLVEAQLLKKPSVASNGVPYDTKISNGVVYLDLSKGIKYWANKIIKLSKLKPKDYIIKKAIKNDISIIEKIFNS